MVGHRGHTGAEVLEVGVDAQQPAFADEDVELGGPIPGSRLAAERAIPVATDARPQMPQIFGESIRRIW